MTSVSNISASGIYGNVLTPQSRQTSTAMPGTLTDGVTTSLGSLPAEALTYNPSGLLTSSQTAQSTLLAVQNTITQTLGSLMSGSQKNAATPFDANPAEPMAPGKMTAQAAQNAYLATQNMITQSLNSI